MAKSLRSKTHRALMAVLVGTRRQKGLTQRDLAQRLRRPHTWIGKVETGERRLDIGEFVELARALGEDPEKLFRRVLRW